MPAVRAARTDSNDAENVRRLYCVGKHIKATGITDSRVPSN